MSLQRLICDGAATALTHTIDDCNRELGRIRGVILFDENYAVETLMSKITSETPSVQQEALALLDAGIQAGSIILIPQTTGTYNGGEAKTTDAFRDGETRKLWDEYTLEFKDPSYWLNKDFWQAAEQRRWRIAWRTETLLRYSDKAVNIIAKDPVEDNLQSTVTWNITATWKSKNKPAITAMGLLAEFLDTQVDAGGEASPSPQTHRVQEWGYIIGNIEAQHDLIEKLNAKAALIHTHTTDQVKMANDASKLLTTKLTEMDAAIQEAKDWAVVGWVL